MDILMLQGSILPQWSPAHLLQLEILEIMAFIAGVILS